MASSKQAVVTAEEPRNELVPGGDAGLPAHLQNYESTGAGVPTEAADFLIPMAKVLDAKSPEVEKRGAAYVQGAEPGDILVKNAPVPLIKGETGFLFQPCYREQYIIEWVPRNRGGGGGSGFQGRLPFDFFKANKDDVEMKPHPDNPQKLIPYRKSTGNQLVDTRYVGGYAILESGPLPMVLPFSSTGHSVAKQWNMLIATKRLRKTDIKPADLYLVFYRVATQLRTRSDQSWYLFEIKDAGQDKNGLPTTYWAPTPEDVERGKTLHDQLSNKEKDFDVGAADPHNEPEIPF